MSNFISAGVVINGTRVIYPENEKEVNVRLQNRGDLPVITQSWIDIGDIDASPENIDIPFIVSPPISRINSNKSQVLRIVYTSAQIPDDRESVYWLNVLEIPGTKKVIDDNRLQIAFRSRVKLFFRPNGLKGDPSAAAESLLWSIRDNKLIVKNQCGFSVSLASININNKNIDMGVNSEMVMPFSEKEYKIKKQDEFKNNKVVYQYINDWGAVNSKEALVY